MAAFRNIGLAASDGHPPAIFDVAEGSWKLREGIQDRVRDKMQRTIPDELARHDALTLLAFAIECSDEERGDAWYLRETSHGLALVAGRQLACKIGRSKVQVGVVGPISEAVRESLGAAVEDDDEFKIIPGSLLLKFPAGQAATAVELLKDSISSFIALAMA